jgi:hypothetical protein
MLIDRLLPREDFDSTTRRHTMGRNRSPFPLAAAATLALATAGAAPARADAPIVTTSNPSDDTFVNSAYPDNNDGAQVSLYTGNDGSGVLRSLLRFPLPASFAGRASVNNVQLWLSLLPLVDGTSSSPALETLMPVTEAWSAGFGLSEDPALTTIGAACTTSNAGASWNARNCDLGPLWSAPGGTVTGTSSAQASTAGLPASANLIFDSANSGNTQMAADVQRWTDDPTSNLGWRMTSDTEAVTGALQRFQSSFAGQRIGPPPTLYVTYLCRPQFAAAPGSNTPACTTCTAAARAACQQPANSTFGTNACVDTGPPSMTYSCTCVQGWVAGVGTNGLPACVDRNDCVGNLCKTGGDASASCVDTPAPGGGYSCTCSTGFAPDSSGICRSTAIPVPAHGTPAMALLACVLLVAAGWRLARGVRA